ncbi:MAG TPA: hypothetical protein VFP55_00510 [Solirubrobacteraceae bacterium]|nr:hypothetical protein [Solirubrobacteraceae bacterium]
MSPASPAEDILRRRVFIAGRDVAFGELDRDDVRMRADELRAVTGWGPTARVAPVARAWREMLLAMERADVLQVRELDPAVVRELAPRMWVVAPGGGLL